MLRSVISRTSIALAGSRRAAGTHLKGYSNPSTSTSVLLTRLPNTVVDSGLKDALKDLITRKVELEPGCSLHFVNECEAHVAAKAVEEKFSTKSIVSKVSMPTLLLQNVPEDISADALTKAFVAQAPKSIHISGANTVRVTVGNSKEAFDVMVALKQVNIGGQNLKVTASPIADGLQILSIFNFPPKSAKETVEEVTKVLKTKSTKYSEVELVRQDLVSKKTVSVRFNQHAQLEEEKLKAAFDKAYPGAFEVSKVINVKKPSLFLRNLERIELPDNNDPHESDFIEELELEKFVLKPYNAGIERIQWVRASRDMVPNMAVVYFKSEEAAFAAMKDLHARSWDGVKLSVTYKESAEPAVVVAQMPAELSAEAQKRINNLNIAYVDEFDCAGDETKKRRRYVMATPKDVNYATQVFESLGYAVTVEEVMDQSVEITPTNSASMELLTSDNIAEVLKTLGNESPKSIAVRTNTDAHISFATVQDAQRALDRFNRGEIQLSSGSSTTTTSTGNLVSSSISVLPSYVLQVLGLSTDVPVRTVTEHLSTAVPDAKVVRSDRSALLKFRRNHDVDPGLKSLKSVQVDGQHIKAERYRPLESQGDSAYDEVTSKAHKADVHVDRLNLTVLLKDFMHLDPTTRYQIAKNAFIRELNEFRNMSEDYGLDENEIEEYKATALREAEEEKAKDAALIASEAEATEDAPLSEGQLDRIRKARLRMAQAEEVAKEDEDEVEPIWLMFGGEHFSEAAMEEITDLFYNCDPELEDNATARLFAYYLQMEGQRKYAKDFEEIRSVAGYDDEKDLTVWRDPEYIKELEETARRIDREAREAIVAQTKGRAYQALKDFEKSIGKDSLGLYDNDDTNEDDQESSEDEFDLAGMGADDDFDSDMDITSDGEASSGADSDEDAEQRAARKKKEAKFRQAREDEHLELESDGEGGERLVRRKKSTGEKLKFTDEGGNELNVVENAQGDFVDKSGSVWSLLVVDTDTVQKTLAGGRFVSHRALVVMGNLKGSAGFGVGKGKDVPQAMAAAVRAALRNLVHIDLYDNFGLAHDLYGKHNACTCTIRATPASREMVASPMVEEILNRMGISSASVKMKGNRNPYSQVNALFNALSKHQNLDETAKARGKRYLSIRWAHDHNM